MFPADRNQPIDLLCKSIDWFLYEEDKGRVWVNLHAREWHVNGMTVIILRF